MGKRVFSFAHICYVLEHFTVTLCGFNKDTRHLRTSTTLSPENNNNNINKEQ